MTTYQRIVLAERPQGEVTPSCFRLESVPAPELRDGQVRVRNHFLSLDPYMRMRMDDAKSYAAPQVVGETMIGGTAGEVTESRDPALKPGDTVTGMLGWAEQGVASAKALRKVDATKVPLSAFLGVAGMPGMTAWYGVTQLLALKPNDTVVVSAASGAVGSVVGQLVKQRGCRAVGIAGGPDKCAFVVNELGFDACVDYRAGRLEADLAAAAPKGIDALFENVGGAPLDACLALMNPFGRIALCGLITGYDGAEAPIKNARYLLSMRLSLKGFIISEHLELWPQGLSELAALVAAGTLKYRETVAQGLAAAPEAFMGLLRGKNFGKQLVKLS